MNIMIPIGLKGKTGAYTLLIELNQGIKIKVGKLGVYRFPKGIYTYTGSALGKGATDLRGRLLRHTSKAKRYHWHIDYFLSVRESQIKYIIFFETNGREECTIVKKLNSLNGNVIVKGFGASDCTTGCSSHLLFFEHDIQRVLKIVEDAYNAITAKSTIREITFE